MRNPISGVICGLIQGYRLIFSPILPAHTCRFLPTCSEYGLEAVHTHGAMRGVWLILRRLARCHPWGGSGYDPVPAPSIPTRRG